MKRGREVYAEGGEERRKKVVDLIRSLRFSVPLYRLRQQEGRRRCAKCGKRRQYYCYDCLTVVHPESHPPPLSLPLNVYVVLHPGEQRGKSTSLAASTISPDLHIVEYPEVPSGLDPASTLVLYPSSQSTELGDIADLDAVKNVLFIDSTWQQSKAIARDERVCRFKHVRIKSQTSLFWRFQNNDPTYLATVEAIYYFLREFIANKRQRGTADATPPLYRGEVDDLLFYYINQYVAVQQRYSHDATMQYTTRHFDGYILPGSCWDELVAPPPRDPGERNAA
ncbi:DTW domain-containing protein [Trypanosoma conorhini]|uniref:tRNA-uridine aminocarboxypropyltransferase 1 n=1 Tax=Trypanosoma conorhini TaxID=83891 RepID=A0A422PR44_9TRYP|nr:DTW domain-containing protein [Trypanosoma conorhini]RNF20203.1 DTW domain-containing protein [Trypanosoma conorhini]